MDGGGAGEVQGECRFAHTGAGGDDDHLSGVQAVGEFVEFVEARGHTDGVAVVGSGALDFFNCGPQDF